MAGTGIPGISLNQEAGWEEGLLGPESGPWALSSCCPQPPAAPGLLLPGPLGGGVGRSGSRPAGWLPSLLLCLADLGQSDLRTLSRPWGPESSPGCRGKGLWLQESPSGRGRPSPLPLQLRFWSLGSRLVTHLPPGDSVQH